MRQDNLPESPDHLRRHWYCSHNPAGYRRESGTFNHSTSDTPILNDHEVSGASDHIDPRYCVHCPAPTYHIPLVTYELPKPHPQTSATNSASSPPHAHVALLPTLPPRTHPHTYHRHCDTATDHSSSLTSSTHQRRHEPSSCDQEDYGITVSEAYWPAGIKPITNIPGKSSEIHKYPGSLEREHVGAGDSFMEMSEITVMEKAWSMLHQLLSTLCL